MIIEFLLSIGLMTGADTADPRVTEVDFIPPVSDVVTYPPEGVLVPMSALPLPPDTLTAYQQEFQAGLTYYGAFAIGKDGSYGYVTGSNSIEAARDIAFEECLKYAPGCLIYAEILPIGYQPIRRGQVTMSAEATGIFQGAVTRPSRTAMAISEDGAYSLVWGHGTQSSADTAAMTDCDAYRITDLPALRDMPCVAIPLP